MAPTTYRFVTNLVAGRRVQLFYQTTGIVAGNITQQHLLPHVWISTERFREILAESETPLRDRPFRITRDYGQHVDLEFVTGSHESPSSASPSNETTAHPTTENSTTTSTSPKASPNTS